ncbi:hypothetical protein Tco_0847755 [Tanacetum coccineum]
MYHEEGTFFMMNMVQETIFRNEEKYTPPMIESNTEEDDDVLGSEMVQGSSRFPLNQKIKIKQRSLVLMECSLIGGCLSGYATRLQLSNDA